MALNPGLPGADLPEMSLAHFELIYLAPFESTQLAARFSRLPEPRNLSGLGVKRLLAPPKATVGLSASGEECGQFLAALPEDPKYWVGAGGRSTP